MRQQLSFQAPATTIRQMAELAAWWELPEQRHNTAVIIRAIEQVYQEEKSRRSHEKNAA